MADQVELGVKSELDKIIADLNRINAAAKEVSDSLGDTGQNLGDELQGQTKRTNRFFQDVSSFGRKVANQLASDFKTLASMGSLQQAFNFSNIIGQSITQAMGLADTIRKFGAAFGVARQDFGRFQADLMKGLSEIGLSSDAIGAGLEGMASTPIKDINLLKEYIATAGKLAQIGGEQGSESDITKNLFQVIQARGGDFTDSGEIQRLAESVRTVFNQTGKGPNEVLSQMTALFARMPKDLREAISTSGISNLSAISNVAGPGGTAFLEEFLGKSPIARMAFEAQGGKGLVTDQGIDLEKFQGFAESVMGRVSQDPRFAVETLGLSEDAAEGFIRLYENLDLVREAQERIARSTGDLTQQYRDSMGPMDAFRANLNRVTGLAAEPLAFIGQKTADILSKTAESDAGAIGMMAGGGAIAALLAGFGARGVGGALARGAAAESITGQKTQPVYVVNAGEISGGMSKALQFGMVGLAGAAGVGAGTLIEKGAGDWIDQQLDKTISQNKEGESMNFTALDNIFYALNRLVGGDLSKQLDPTIETRKKAERLEIELKLKSKDVEPVNNQNRGVSF